MSIIEDTLDKVARKRAAHPVVGEPHGEPTTAELNASARGGAKQEYRSLRTFAAIAAIAAAVAWFGLDYAQKEQMEAARQLAIRTKPLAPLGGLGQEDEPAPIAETAAAPEESLPAGDEASPLAQAVPAEPAADAAVDTAQDAPPGERPPFVPSRTEGPKFAVAPAEGEAPAIPAETETPAPAAENPAAGWIGGGWNALERSGSGRALAVWEKGFREQPSAGRKVLIVSAYTQEETAFHKLRQLGPGLDAFVIPGAFGGKPAWYLLSQPPAEEVTGRSGSIRQRFGLPSVRHSAVKDFIAQLDAGIGSHAATKVASAPASPKRPPAPSGHEQERTKFVAAIGHSAPELIAVARKEVGEGRYDDAIGRLEPEIARLAAYPEAYLLMGTAYLGSGDFDAADNYLNQGIALDGREPRFWVQKGVIAQQRGENALALRHFRQAEKLAPDLPEVQFNLGYSSDALRQPEAAVRAYRTFLGLTEGEPRYVNLRRTVLDRLAQLGY